MVLNWVCFHAPFLASAQPEQVRLCTRLDEMAEFLSSISRLGNSSELDCARPDEMVLKNYIGMSGSFQPSR